MDRINIIVKVTEACNLRCKYCYNKDSDYSAQVLGLERFTKLIDIVAPYRKDIHIIWHGGEPLTAGLEYFENAMRIEDAAQTKYRVTIKNQIQTNGTLIDKKWIELFKKYDIKPGISFDGLQNDKYRQRTEDTLRAFKLLAKNGMRSAAMAVVADDDYDILENYKYFAKLGINVEFSPVFEEGGAAEMGSRAQRFAENMTELFDYWLYDKNGVDVRLFATYVSMALGTNFRICNNSSCHGKYLGVAPDGTIYNCGRYSVTQYPFGNVDDFSDLNEIYRSDGFMGLVAGAFERRQKCRESCEYFNLCSGGCTDCALIENGLNNIPQQSCMYFKTLYPHIKAAVDKILAEKQPLDGFNPFFRRAVIKSFAVTDDATGADIQDKYK
ncbi:MAG: radical SAM protein [Clostridiales bacterium]|nr:radical SAM protein [Clostridiales bacterium]